MRFLEYLCQKPNYAKSYVQATLMGIFISVFLVFQFTILTNIENLSTKLVVEFVNWLCFICQKSDLKLFAFRERLLNVGFETKYPFYGRIVRIPGSFVQKTKIWPVIYSNNPDVNFYNSFLGLSIKIFNIFQNLFTNYFF